MKSENQDFLESLEVTQDELLLDKKQQRQMDKNSEELKKEIKKDQDSNLMKTKSIFEGRDSSDSEEETEKKTSHSEKLSDDSKNDDHMSNDDFREGSRDVTPEQLRKLKQILELAEWIPEVLGAQQQNPTFNRAGFQAAATYRQIDKNSEGLKKEVKKDQDSNLKKTKSIFEGSDSSDSEEETEKKTSHSEKLSDDSENDDHMSNDDFREGSREGKKKDDFFEQSNTRRSSTEEQRTCICLQFPEVTPEQLRKLKQILELAESIPENRVVALESSQDSMDATVNGTYIRGSRIIVNAFKVDNIGNMHKRNPREMIRNLMKLILGEEILKHSSPTGKMVGHRSL
ncbi:hypothetical protein TSAR_006519 [Trichomalopsis sarcophagae]|uniref:Uncharacterized protein n=1 Tax=Trichomalopsis sarcophagae TaxID=543379 RepID=A0A232EH84_9HYME|nr:hypothetical protein TSAR_006519 [Trichomalopsis sarcophagae]